MSASTSRKTPYLEESIPRRCLIKYQHILDLQLAIRWLLGIVNERLKQYKWNSV
jgi:hypothetical protein